MTMEFSSDHKYLYMKEVSIGLDTYMEDFKTHLLPVVKPEWKDVELGSKVFDSGVTNKLVALYDKNKGLKMSGEDVVLLRMNGTGSDEIIDRDDEISCILTVHEAGLCPPIHARLKNGLCYGFSPGDQMTLEEAREKEVQSKIARLLAQLHSIKITSHFKGRKPQIWAKIDDWLLKVPTHFEDPDKQKCFVDSIVSIDSLKENITWMRSLINTTSSPVVFCHNDTLVGNFIMDKDKGFVRLVDYEYGGPNYLPFDIADHFCEYAGIDEVNYDLYPDEVYQLEWLKVYLEERAVINGGDISSVTSEDVMTLYQEVRKFTVAAHMFWTVWSLLQAVHSTINFDYMKYAAVRYCEFLKRKDTYL